MKKKILLAIVLFATTAVLFSQSNSSVSIFEKLTVIETKYFDIIFPKSSKQTAEYLAIHADSLYEKAAAFVGVENLVRIPVVISNETDVLNAYFTIIPYSRIVLYDTAPSQSLAVFDDTILSVFYHELIHAVSLKNNQQNIFLWDDATPVFTIIDMPPSMTEGVAVSAESADGYGRLNSSYSTHVVRQAKIEDTFPSWADVAGSYSAYTDGSLPYIFGGAFTQYLNATYGLEKLSEYWKESSKLNLTTYVYAFKKIYGISIDDAWKDFAKAVEVSQDIKEPQSFFAEQRYKYMYQNVASSSLGLVWQDYFSNSVYFLPHDTKKERFLFSTDLHSRLAFSSSGKYLVVSGETGYPEYTNTVRVFDMEEQKFIKTQKEIRDATILEMPTTISSEFSETKNIVVGVATKGQMFFLQGYDISTNDNNLLFDIPFEYGSIIFSPVDAGEGRIIALHNKGGKWGFYSYNIFTKEQKFFQAPENMQSSDMSDLYVANEKLYMSIAKDASMQSVLAWASIQDFETGVITLNVDSTQLSGGVFSPVLLPAIDTSSLSDTVAFVSRFYNKRDLSIMNVSKEHSEQILFAEYNPVYASDTNYTFDTKGYNPFKYVYDGMFVPVIGSVNLNAFNEDFITGFSLGASMYFLDPAERLLFGGGAGYDFFTDKYTATFSSVFTEQYFTFSTDAFLSMSTSGFEKSATNMLLDIYIPIISDFNRIGFASNFTWLYSIKTDEFLFEGSTVENDFSIYFSRLRRTGSSIHEKLGFVIIKQFYVNKYFGDDAMLTDELMMGDILKIEVFLPQLLPFKNPSNFTVNMPFSIGVTKYFNFNADWQLEGSAILFSYDIQKAFPHLLFFHQVTLDAGFQYLSKNDKTYEAKVLASLYTTTSINFGLPAGYPLDLGLNVEWDTLKKGVEALELGFKFGLNF